MMKHLIPSLAQLNLTYCLANLSVNSYGVEGGHCFWLLLFLCDMRNKLLDQGPPIHLTMSSLHLQELKQTNYIDHALFQVIIQDGVYVLQMVVYVVCAVIVF